MVVLNLILHLLWAYRASAARSIFFLQFMSFHGFFMPFSYFIHYQVPFIPLSPLPFCFNFFFFPPHIHYCLLKLSSLLDISLRWLKIKNVLAGHRYHSHTASPGECPPLPFYLFCSHLVSSSYFHGSSVWSHSSPFPWLQLAKPAVSIPFFFTVHPSSTPACLHSHIATGHKGTAGLISGPV